MQRHCLFILTIFVTVLFSMSLWAAPNLSAKAKGAALKGLNLYLTVTVENLMPGETSMVEIYADDQLIDQQELTAGENDLKIEGVRLDAGRHIISARGC